MEKLSIVLAASATLLAQNSALPDSSRNPSNVMMRAFPIGTLVTLNALMNAVAFAALRSPGDHNYSHSLTSCGY